MDIKQLRYFVSIVDNNFNLSHAAQSLYISQPALSMMINDFEATENIQLFQRRKGRIIHLTPVGEKYYDGAVSLLKEYDLLFKTLHDKTQEIKGNITIGIPPLVLSVVFSTIMPELILENPNISFQIVETGAHQLKDELMLGNVDLAVLLSPTSLPSNMVESFDIQTSELAAFVSPHHALASKKQLEWHDFNQQKLALFDPTFMIHHLLKKEFERHHVYPHIILTSGSWDFLLNSTKINPNLVTILPKPLIETYPDDDVICLPINKPVVWQVVISRLKKDGYSETESYILEELLRRF